VNRELLYGHLVSQRGGDFLLSGAQQIGMKPGAVQQCGDCNHDENNQKAGAGSDPCGKPFPASP
jgi:hypothetical protein